MRRRIYAGIGSQQTPPAVLTLMYQWAVYLAQHGYTLRSGRAFGADSAFENGCNSVNGIKQIFLAEHAKYRSDWRAHAAQYHPAWRDLPAGAQLLHARNSPIMLGGNLIEPVDFVLCWTPDGKPKGGTGQALRIAADPHWSIPVFNLWYPGEATDGLKEWLSNAQ